MKVKLYSVTIRDGSGIFEKQDTFTMIELDVLAENDRYMVVDDRHYTTIDKLPVDKYSLYSGLNKHSIGIYSQDSCYGNAVHYILYSTATKKASTIRKEIEKEITKKFGFFTGKIDLSFIKD